MNVAAAVRSAFRTSLFRANFHAEGERLSPAWALQRLKDAASGKAGMMMAGPIGEMEFGQVPAFSELGAYGVMLPDAVEAIRQPLYDSLLYATAGATTLRFFQNPLGQGLSSSPGQANNPKGLADTNMELAGQLPSPKAFLATSIEIIFEAGSVATANTFTPLGPSGPRGALPSTNGTLAQMGPAEALNDIQAVLQSGWLQFYVIAKDYLNLARGDSFPPKSHLSFEGAVSAGGTLNILEIGVAGRAVGRPFYLNPPLLLMPSTNFSVNMNWPSAIATPSGFNGRMICRLDGFMYRNAQ